MPSWYSLQMQNSILYHKKWKRKWKKNQEMSNKAKNSILRALMRSKKSWCVQLQFSIRIKEGIKLRRWGRSLPSRRNSAAILVQVENWQEEAKKYQLRRRVEELLHSRKVTQAHWKDKKRRRPRAVPRQRALDLTSRTTKTVAPPRAPASRPTAMPQTLTLMIKRTQWMTPTISIKIWA